MTEEKHYDPAQTRMLLVGSVIAITLAAFAALAVSTIMPKIAEELEGITLYPLAFGMALAGQLVGTAAAGGWADSRGPTRVLAFGLMLFVGGLAICGLAPTMRIFILGRLLQGLGGGFLMVPMYVLVGALVPPMKRPSFFAAFAAAWVGPAIVGPYLAGVALRVMDWRIIFATLIPLILLAAVFILPLLKGLPKVRKPVAPRVRKVILSAAGAGIGVSLIQIGSSYRGALYLLIFVGIALLIVSLPYLFPEGTARLRRGLPALIASRGCVNAAFIATETFLPLLLNKARNWTLSSAGLVLTVGAATWALGAWLQSRPKAEQYRKVFPVWGPLILAGGILLTALPAFPAVSASFVFFGWAIGGIGIGLTYPTLSVTALDSVPEASHGEVSSALQLADALGGAASMAAITGVFSIVATWPTPWPYLPGPIWSVALCFLAAYAGSRIHSH